MKQQDYLQARRDLRKREGEVPVGARNAFAEKVRELVEYRGDQVREELGSDDAVKEFVTAIREGVKKRDRTCIIQYAKVMKLVDVEIKVVHELIHQMGAKTLDELKRGFATAKAAEGVDHPTAIERSTAYLEGILPSFEQYRQTVIKRLGGYLPIDSDRIGTDGSPVAGA